MNYTEVLNSSLGIWWKHKALWAFGIFPGVLMQIGYYLQTGFVQGNSSVYPVLPGLLGPILDYARLKPEGVLIGLVLAYVMLWLLDIGVSALSRGAIIGMVKQASAEGTTSFGGGWRIGFTRVRPMYALSLLGALTAPAFLVLMQFLIVAMLGGPLIPGKSDPLQTAIPGNVYGWLGFCCLGSIAVIVFQFVMILAVRACVLEQLSVWPSILRGWSLLQRHPGYVVWNAMLLFVVVLALTIPAQAAGRAMWMPIAKAILAGTWPVGMTHLTLGFAAYLLIIQLGVGGIVGSFTEVVWTRLFQGFVESEAAKAAGATPLERNQDETSPIPGT